MITVLEPHERLEKRAMREYGYAQSEKVYEALHQERVNKVLRFLTEWINEANYDYLEVYTQDIKEMFPRYNEHSSWAQWHDGEDKAIAILEKAGYHFDKHYYSESWTRRSGKEFRIDLV